MTVLDIGANLGYFTLLWPSCREHRNGPCVRAQTPDIARRLRKKRGCDWVRTMDYRSRVGLGALAGTSLSSTEGEPKNAFVTPMSRQLRKFCTTAQIR
jgi:hypothetical protein